jgi:hypothetical protein
MTAIVFAGRTGAAFAAQIGTHLSVNEADGSDRNVGQQTTHGDPGRGWILAATEIADGVFLTR